jgi:hypothetical protein
MLGDVDVESFRKAPDEGKKAHWDIVGSYRTVNS